MGKYLRVSERLMTVMLEFTDMVEQVSIDEAFLDVTGSRRLLGCGVEIARRIKARIFEDQRLTASVGVAANKFVAKVASDLEKPDGLVAVAPGREQDFLSPLPIRRLWGVGPKTEEALLRLGIQRIGDIARTDRGDLVRRLGLSGEHLWQRAHGLDDRPVAPEEGFKSIRTVIFAILTSVAAWKGTSGIDDVERKMISELMKKAEISVIISFGCSYVLRYFKEADVLIAAYEATEQAQKAVIKCLQREMDFQGRLPVKI